MKYTTQTLLDRVSVKAAIPVGQTTFTDEQILDLATQELLSTVLPEILKTREDYYLHDSLLEVGNGKELYNLPERAVASKINDVQRVTSSGYESIPRTTVSELTNHNPGNNILSFYFKGAYLGISPVITNTETLRISYYLTPSTLVLPDQSYQVTAIENDAGNNLYYAVDRDPTTLFGGDEVDVAKGNGLHQTILTEAKINTITENRIYFEDVRVDIEVGDYIVPVGQSHFVQCPRELYPWLEELVTVKIHEANGDYDAMKLSQGKADRLKMQILSLLSPRAETEAQIIDNRLWRRF